VHTQLLSGFGLITVVCAKNDGEEGFLKFIDSFVIGSAAPTHLPNEIFQLLLHQFPPRSRSREENLAEGSADTKIKGCDFGYALAANSCEGVGSVDTCTIAAPDAITAFAIPNPSYPSQGKPVFSGLVVGGLPRRTDHPAYFGLAKYYLTNPFSRRRTRK
jgi:hypothetical protein